MLPHEGSVISINHYKFKTVNDANFVSQFLVLLHQKSDAKRPTASNIYTKYNAISMQYFGAFKRL
ncbi:hypothetical protein BLOT_015489 [Blomia tropicalis]|nr:hypothetical protein BLOT_015489 [Blomia tropicalis]